MGSRDPEIEPGTPPERSYEAKRDEEERKSDGIRRFGDWERPGGQILDTFIKSGSWGGGPGAEGIGGLYGDTVRLGPLIH